MDGFGAFWDSSDGVGRAVTLLLLAMSVSAWVTILWKAWVLQRARRDVARAVPAFWAAPGWAEGRERLALLDREQVLLPLLDAATATPLPGTLDSGAQLDSQLTRRLRDALHHGLAHLQFGQVLLPLLDAATTTPLPDTLDSGAQLDSQLTRRLRDALHRGLAHLQFGQVLLASIGSTSPFIGLFGTVWGIYHALASIAAAGTITIDKVAGPVGEALIMTAAGLAVAIPAVLAYNLFGKWVGAAEAELEGFAHDLREIRIDRALAPER